MFSEFTEEEKYGPKSKSWSEVYTLIQLKQALNRVMSVWMEKINGRRSEKAYKYTLGSFYLMVISDLNLAVVLFVELKRLNTQLFH